MDKSSANRKRFTYFRWQWCLWHRYVGDRFEILVTESICSLFFSLCWWFFQYIKSVTNTFGLRHPSPTSHDKITFNRDFHIYRNCFIDLEKFSEFNLGMNHTKRKFQILHSKQTIRNHMFFIGEYLFFWSSN